MKALKGKAVVSLASLAVLGGVGLGSIQAFALDTPVKVQFQADGHITEPDPDALQLRFVPDLVDFGATHVAGNAVAQQVNTTNKYVALYDGRDSGNEWTLSASASNLANVASPTQVIDSGTIDVAVGTVKDWAAPSEPTSTNVTTDAANITVDSANVVAGSVALSLDGTSKDIVKTNAGLADHGYALPISSMTLNLADSATASAAGQTYTGEITWALSDSF
ncbi:WxL domain-containing protein [Candidatus Enterococcus ferrettii]|uniref:WxL domain-containing protein n=1 Tax=Candidatus Enterococcus ferrettii TaxID=2815324 RepID=A0ABV0EKS2_9ENTE|nr:WxL domain-containing protein [Enterococcus sp. 665A]MBO1340911.1 WxL domain-containing protein [Enterococcus sp. 665A]